MRTRTTTGQSEEPTAHGRRASRFCALLIATLALALAIVAAPARAGTYTVLSCDAANAGGFSPEAWSPSGNAGTAYQACPSLATDTGGISNRIVGSTVGLLAHSEHTISAPPGATITSIRWSGRWARTNCTWGAALRALPSAATVLGAPANGQCLINELDTRPKEMPLTPPAGTTALQQIVFCGASTCDSGATFHTRYAAVTINDPTAPALSAGGPLASGRWVGGQQQVSVAASDNAGIAASSVSLGSTVRSQQWPCRFTRARPCEDRTLVTSLPTDAVPQGRNEIVVMASDAAGNSAAARTAVYIDNEPPPRIRPVVEGGEGWRSRNGFRVSWENPPQAYAPIVRARYRLCHAGSCSDGVVDGRDVRTLGELKLAEPGEHTLQVWLEDEAGNHSYELTASEPVGLRLDQEAPSLAFTAPDPGDPLRVAVGVSDRDSGVEGGEIEIRRRGGGPWTALPTAREGNRLVAYVDDDRFGDGAYELRARARDLAGNVAVTDRRTDGSRATLDLPARFATRLSVGAPRTVGRGRRRAVRLVSALRVRHGAQVRLEGRLENSDGQPIPGASVDVSADSPGDAVGLVPAGLARTDRDGRFAYVARATRNKLLRFRYAGSRRIRAAAADFTLTVPAASTIAASPRRLRNGQTVHLSGTVLTRPLPPAGKLIEVQAFFRGRFRTFSTTRADARGRWRFDYRFGGTRGRVPYRLRALLPAEGGYPFLTGRSPVAKVLVVGP
jgi:hypothetical protein